MLQINSKKKSIPVVEGQMTELSFSYEGRNCSPVKVTIECYVDAKQLNDFDGDANEVVFQLKMPNYRRVNNSNIYCGSGEVVLSKDDINRLSKYLNI